MVQRLLTTRGTVDVDARTNTLIIKDINAVIDEAVGAGEGDRHADAAGADRVEDRRGQPRLLARARCGVGVRHAAAGRRVRRVERSADGPGRQRRPAPRQLAVQRHQRHVQPRVGGEPDHERGERPGGLRRLPAGRQAERGAPHRGGREQRRGQGDLEPARRDARQPPGHDRAGRVDPLPDLRERRRQARVHRRRAEARRDAAHHRRPEHHHEARGAAQRAGRQRADADRLAGDREERGRPPRRSSRTARRW